MKTITMDKMEVYNTYTDQPILTITIFPLIKRINILGWYDNHYADLALDNNDPNSIHWRICNN